MLFGVCDLGEATLAEVRHESGFAAFVALGFSPAPLVSTRCRPAPAGSALHRVRGTWVS
jgi:hypothetical protein